MFKSRKPTTETSPQRIVVIGNGMVSHRFCTGFAASETLKTRYQLTVIGEEPHPAYDRTKLSAGAVRRLPPPLLARTDWYQDVGIDLRLGVAVQRIDRGARLVVLDDGTALPYDKLVLATGAQAFVPPIAGVDSDGVFVYRTHADADRICEAAEGKRRAVVIGGGLLGLEAARILSDLRCEVHVVENSKYLMFRQLDADSGLLLDQRVRNKRIDTHLGYRLERIEPAADDTGLSLHFEGEAAAMQADLVVMATGIRPRDELAAAAELRVGSRGGVIVDDHLRSSDPNIFAIGECAVHRGKHYGLVAPGYAMADVLVARLSGDRKRRFDKGDTSCELKLLGIPVAAVGLADQEGRREVFEDERGRRTLVMDGRRLIGATAVGEWPQLTRVRDAANREARISKRQLQRFLSTGDLWEQSDDESVADWPPQTVICNCMGVSRGQLSACVAEGLVSVDALTRRTGAGSVCGSCKPLLGQIAGAPTEPVSLPGRASVLVASIATLLAAPLLMALGPVPDAQSVTDAVHHLAELWRDPIGKQITGYTLVGLTAIGLLMSARKRIGWFRFGSYGLYRALHTIVSLVALMLTAIHTGLHMGSNVNFALMGCFLAVAVVGAVAGMATAFESSGGSTLARRARQLRPALALAHTLLVWPIPLLLGLHIFSVYYF